VTEVVQVSSFFKVLSDPPKLLDRWEILVVIVVFNQEISENVYSLDTFTVGEVNPGCKVLELICHFSISSFLNLHGQQVVGGGVEDRSSVIRFDFLELRVEIFIELWIDWLQSLQLSSEDGNFPYFNLVKEVGKGVHDIKDFLKFLFLHRFTVLITIACLIILVTLDELVSELDEDFWAFEFKNQIEVSLGLANFI